MHHPARPKVGTDVALLRVMNSIIAIVLMAAAQDVAEARRGRVYSTPKGMTRAEWLQARAAREARNAARVAAMSEKPASKVDTAGKSDTVEPTVMATPTVVPTLPPPVPPAAIFPQPKAEPAPQPTTQWMLVGALGVALLSAALLAHKRKPKAAGAATFEVIATHAVAPKQKLQVIEVAGQRLLMSVTDKGITLLCALPNQPPVAPPMTDTFEDTLAHAFADVAPSTEPDLAPSAALSDSRAAATRVSEEVAGIARLRQKTPAQRLAALRYAA